MQQVAVPLVEIDVGTPRPFLKWAGGKTQLLKQLIPLVPQFSGTYHEPFLGGAAMFFSLRPRNARLSDVNEELISCYAAVRDGVDDVIDALGQHLYDKEHYYSIRDIRPQDLPPAHRAARMIYLNKSAFNGLYRVNSSGQFNVPFGRHRNPLICDPANLNACSVALQNARIQVFDFEESARTMRAGDFVYFDPPYVPVSSTANFTAYSRQGFSWEHQMRLASLFEHLSAMGISAMLSNSDTPEVRKLYNKFRIQHISAKRRINSKVDGRGEIAELVVLNY